MTILITTDAVGGVWTYSADLARGLLAAGLEVTLAVLGPAPRAAQLRMLPDGVRVVETGGALDWLAGDVGEIEVAARALAEVAASCDARLIHLNAPSYAALAQFPVPVVGVCHSCLASWWAAVRGTALPTDFEWRTALLRAGLHGCDRVVAPSAAFARTLGDLYGVRAQVVQNGRGHSPRPPHDKQSFVLTAGRLWDAGKNVAALDDAAGCMACEVRAAGAVRGPRGDVVALANLRLLGLLDDDALAAQLDAAAIFVSLARYEPFGLGVLEAAHAGCALVLSDIPSFRELWDGAAIFVAPDDAAGTAALLDDLLRDRAETERLGQLARHHARRYGVAEMVRGTLEMYRQVGLAMPCVAA